MRLSEAELPLSASTFIKKLNVHVEVPENKDLRVMKAEHLKVSRQLLLAYSFPLVPLVVRHQTGIYEVNNGYSALINPEEVQERTDEALDQMGVPDVTKEPHEVDRFIGGVYASVVNAVAENPNILIKNETRKRPALTPIAVAALGVLGAHLTDVIRMNGESKSVNEKIDGRINSELLFYDYRSLLKPHVVPIRTRIVEVTQGIPADRVPSHVLPTGSALPDR